MNRWSDDELRRIAESDELEIASVRSDGSLRRPVTIWVVRVGDDVYVRSVTGRSASWFHGAQDRHEARVSVGGVTKDVRLIETEEDADAIDAAYRAKYRRYAAHIVESIIAPHAGATTLKLVPRATASGA